MISSPDAVGKAGNRRPQRDAVGYALEQVRGAARPGPPPFPVEDLPGLEILRELGRGGQAFVYEAVQRSTGRRVAVKILRTGPLATRREERRFRREVDILANLRHPGITTIHDAGTAGGFPFVIMEYVEGLPLDEYLELHEPPVRERVALMQQVAAVVEVAHRHGVVHRDLKPGNIRIDDDGRPHVLDFGLARYTSGFGGRVSETATAAGGFAGSLKWASPEQLNGRREEIDTRTDVYALGVLLYEVLAGRWPFETDGTTPDVLHKILHADPVPLRRSAPRLDADLETIVGCCLQKEPARRYQHAGELAQDLDRYLQGRPIEAKRDHTAYVLGKWIRRHRLVSTLIVLLTIGVVGYAVSVTTLLRRTRQARDRAEAAMRASLHNFDAALGITQFLIDTAAAKLEALPGGGDLRRRTLEEAYRRLRLLSTEHPDDPRLLDAFARIHLQQSNIDETLGRFEAALGHAEAARDAYAERLAADPDDRGLQRAYALSLVRFGDLVKTQGRLTETGDAYRQAHEIYRSLADAAAPDARSLDDLCWSYERLGDMASRRGDYGQALALHERQLTTARRLEEAGAEETAALYARFAAYAQLAHVNASRKDLLRALDAAEQAVALGERLVARRPHHVHYRLRLAGVCERRGDILMSLGRSGPAATAYRRADDILDTLIADGERSLPVLVGRMIVEEGLMNAAIFEGNYREAITVADRLRERVEAVLAYDPENGQALLRLFTLHWHAATAWGQLGDPTRKAEQIRLARETFERARQAGRVKKLSWAYAAFLLEFAHDEASRRAALEAAQKAVTMMEHTPSPYQLGVLGCAQRAVGQREAAVATLERALAALPPSPSVLRADIEAYLDEWRREDAAASSNAQP